MRTRIVLALIVLALVVPFAAAREKPAPLDVVPSVDLDRYAGVWYEVARLPNRFEADCAGDVTATYTPRDGGGLTVVNQCRRADGSTIRAEGRARLASAAGPASKLEVRFAPRWLSWLPVVWGDYWVIELADDYRYAVVGSPDREYLWILSRTPSLDDATMAELTGRIAARGFDASKIVRVTNAAR
jgi:apolipoprotein D and lipocalin family protein